MAEASAVDGQRGSGDGPSKQSQRGLDWLNFFVADIQTSFGPFLALYLAAHGWTASAINYMTVVFDLASTRSAFSNTLMSKGAVGSEMEYLWDLIMQDK